MKKNIILLFLLPCLFLTGCGKKKEPEFIPQEGVLPGLSEVTPAPEPVIYNHIDEESSAVRKEMRDEVLAAANACKELYNEADKGNTFNVILPRSTVVSMVYKLAELGLPAVDYERTLDLQSPQPLLDLGYALFSTDDLSAAYYEVYNDGQITAYRLERTHGQWMLLTASVGWDKNGEAKIITEGKYAVNDVQFTAKGWLIYNRDYSSFDDNQKSNSDSYVFLRVKPYDSMKRELCEKYIKPIGYLENNLFTTSWNESYYTPIDFNSLYASLFGRYNGTEPLTAYNALSYYSRIDRTNLFLIPTGTFEKTVQNYFNIRSDTLKGISDYSSALGGYLFLGYDKDYYNVLPRTPEPEVVDYWYNFDGTITLRVDAINKWYGTDKAFTHDVTIREEADGGFKYVSNNFYASDDNILPECKLAYLLNVERAKTKY